MRTRLRRLVKFIYRFIKKWVFRPAVWLYKTLKYYIFRRYRITVSFNNEYGDADDRTYIAKKIIIQKEKKPTNLTTFLTILFFYYTPI